MYSRAKVAGTFLCVVGAIIMSLMQSNTVEQHMENEAKPSPRLHGIFDKNTIIGCLYLIAAVFVLSSQVVLQVGELVGSRICMHVLSDFLIEWWKLII